jgi:hypothetical protein
MVFKETYEMGVEGERKQNYYVNEHVGIACCFLISAIHDLGLVTLTHAPSPMNFLPKTLKPSQKRTLIFIATYRLPAEATMPDIKKKTSEEVIDWFE